MDHRHIPGYVHAFVEQMCHHSHDSAMVCYNAGSGGRWRSERFFEHLSQMAGMVVVMQNLELRVRLASVCGVGAGNDVV